MPIRAIPEELVKHIVFRIPNLRKVGNLQTRVVRVVMNFGRADDCHYFIRVYYYRYCDAHSVKICYVGNEMLFLLYIAARSPPVFVSMASAPSGSKHE